MADTAGWLKTSEQDKTLLIAAGGRWTIPALAPLDRSLRALNPAAYREAVIDLGAVERLDSAGALVLRRTVKQFADSGVAARFAHLRPEHESLLARAERQKQPAPARPIALVRFLTELGKHTVAIGLNARNLLNFFGLMCVAIGRCLRRPGRIRFTAMVNHMERTGFDALPIVGLLSFLIGVVIAFQGIDQLRRFGAEIFVVNLVGVSILREMGILITAIIVAGRSGSAFTAEIGAMKVNQEVDAMTAMGLDPVDILVLPRTFALFVTLPLLTFFADIMGIAGGIAMVRVMLDTSVSQLLVQLHGAVAIQHLWVGLVKAPVFAVAIAMVGCFEGLAVTGSAESVGRLTTKAVVESIFIVIVLDAAFSILFSYLRI